MIRDRADFLALIFSFDFVIDVILADQPVIDNAPQLSHVFRGQKERRAAVGWSTCDHMCVERT